jgi:hypothetical protein
MNRYELNFISDESIFSHVKNTVEKYRFNVSVTDFNRNLVDPIKLTFDAKIYKRDIKVVIEDEIFRQIDKSNTNHIGYFHQNIFTHIGKGWSVPLAGYDVVNKSKHIYVEMKNKHNTMNSSSSQKTYMRMQNTLIKNPAAKCLLVEVIATSSQDIVWRTTLDGTSVSSSKIRRVSIDKFYEIVTGDKLAFKKLCEKLPTIIQDVVDATKFNPGYNTVVQDLQRIDKNLLKSLYLLAFDKYEGFGNFSVE